MLFENLPIETNLQCLSEQQNPSEAAFVLTHVAWALGRAIVLQNCVVKTTAYNAVWDSEVEKHGQKLLNPNHVPFIKSIEANQRVSSLAAKSAKSSGGIGSNHDVNEVSSTSI